MWSPIVSWLPVTVALAVATLLVPFCDRALVVVLVAIKLACAALGVIWPSRQRTRYAAVPRRCARPTQQPERVPLPR